MSSPIRPSRRVAPIVAAAVALGGALGGEFGGELGVGAVRGVAAEELAPIDLGDAEGQPVEAPPSADGVEARLRESEARLAELDAELARSRRERAALEARLAETGGAVDERRARIEGLTADIASFEATLAGLEEDIAAERAANARRRALLADSLVAAYDASRSSPLAVLLQHDDPALADRMAVWTGYAMRAQREAIHRQADALARIEAAHARALKDRNWLEHLKNKASGQRDARVAELEGARGALGEVETRIVERTRSVATLKEDTARLAALMEELRAAEAARSGYFESGKGTWPLPVAGRLDAAFGDVKSVGRLTWTGLFLRADEGTRVTSVADGEVVYGDWLEGFGMLAIVDHGDGWMSLYGGNRDILVTPGDWVESGAPLATVGDSGGHNAAGVYFEIRENAQAVDPAPFLDAEAYAAAAVERGGG